MVVRFHPGAPKFMELLVYRFALQIVILSGWVRLPYDSPTVSSFSLMGEHSLGMTET